MSNKEKRGPPRVRKETHYFVVACLTGSTAGVAPYIELIGAIPQERIMEFYHSAWLFALPCVAPDDGRQDGLPNVLMEAMATGLPVITTKSTAQAELIEHEKDGLLIPAHSPAELAAEPRGYFMKPAGSWLGSTARNQPMRFTMSCLTWLSPGPISPRYFAWRSMPNRSITERQIMRCRRDQADPEQSGEREGC